MLDWKQTDLAKAAGLSEMSVKNVEKGQKDSRMSTIHSIRSALEAAGILFIDQNGNGPGVRLRDRQQECRHRTPLRNPARRRTSAAARGRPDYFGGGPPNVGDVVSFFSDTHRHFLPSKERDRGWALMCSEETEAVHTNVAVTWALDSDWATEIELKLIEDRARDARRQLKASKKQRD